VDDLWATKSEDVGLTVHTINFQDFQPMWSWSTNVTDGQMTCDCKTALCTIVHRVVKNVQLYQHAHSHCTQSWPFGSMCPRACHKLYLY